MMTWWIRTVYPTNMLNIISTWNEFGTFIEATKPLFFDLRSLVVIIFRRMGKFIEKNVRGTSIRTNVSATVGQLGTGQLDPFFSCSSA